MGGKSGQDKGKRGEREVIALLQPVVNEVYEAHDMDAPRLQRNTLQSDKGGQDIVGLDWLAPEVKWCEQLQVYQWWQQTLRQAGAGKVPVLFYKRNKVDWKVRMYGRLGMPTCERLVPVTVDLLDFLDWFRARLVQELSDV